MKWKDFEWRKNNKSRKKSKGANLVRVSQMLSPYMLLFIIHDVLMKIKFTRPIKKSMIRFKKKKKTWQQISWCLLKISKNVTHDKRTAKRKPEKKM